mmetsp:Transcript_62735/g.181840  ORF Transcript_62735/g.181840 Transcript_62735/m.181840 type:complete len:163 (-) Transcript_62735:335-823(-)
MKDQRLILTTIVLLSWGALALAFVPATAPYGKGKTQLELASRRDVLGSMLIGASAVMIPAREAIAFSQQLDDNAFEPQQQATDGKFDLNSAFVGDYKELRGMFPTAAGKIASNGPYKSVKDIYKIPGLTKNDIELFKKYEKEFTVHPPGRTFDERINARVST